ncbi:MAG TPA: hypothetical protein VD862_04490 [Candidatus Paceibacterota bacterium]|nr:hypothetical protein [Candidatus Paceibacterota bacterium]
MHIVRALVTVFLLAALFFSPETVFADALYFEFNPDFAESLLVASSPQPVEQVFLPLNDHLSGFDVWVSTNGTSGTATFQLYNPSSTLISSRVVTVPAIAESSGGMRLKIALPSQVAVTANQPYVVRISTAMPSLRIYYAAQQQVLPHNAPPQAAYTGGLSRIGGEEREFAFKSALYENTESTDPVLTNVSAEILSVQSVRLSFNASEPVDASVQYGPQGQGQAYTVPYSGSYTSCPLSVQSCSVLLTISDPGTAHEFTLTAKDVWGNVTQVNGQFTSAGTSVSPTPGPTTPPPTGTPAPTPPPDTTPPVITNARAVNVTHESVSIAWTTNEAANSLVVIQQGVDKITVGGGSDSTLELEHLIPVSDLAQQSSYTAVVRSGDASGNESAVEFTFSTVAAPTPGPGPGGTPTPPPAPTPTISIGPSGDGDGQTIQWQEPASGAPSNGYRVDIIGADGQLIETLYTHDTSLLLANLPDGARIVIYADNGDGVFEKVGAPATHKKSTPFLELLFTYLPHVLAGAGAVVVIGALVWRAVHKKPEPPAGPPGPPEEPSPFVSHR